MRGAVRSFMSKWIYPQARKYHILLTFICWQSDLKYRSTISFIITFYGNNRYGAEQRFWLGASSVVLRALQTARLCKFSWSQHVAIIFKPNHTDERMDMAIKALSHCIGDILCSELNTVNVFCSLQSLMTFLQICNLTQNKNNNDNRIL